MLTLLPSHHFTTWPSIHPFTHLISYPFMYPPIHPSPTHPSTSPLMIHHDTVMCVICIHTPFHPPIIQIIWLPTYAFFSITIHPSIHTLILLPTHHSTSLAFYPFSQPASQPFIHPTTHHPSSHLLVQQLAFIACLFWARHITKRLSWIDDVFSLTLCCRRSNNLHFTDEEAEAQRDHDLFESCRPQRRTGTYVSLPTLSHIFFLPLLIWRPMISIWIVIAWQTQYPKKKWHLSLPKLETGEKMVAKIGIDTSTTTLHSTGLKASKETENRQLLHSIVQ